MEFGESSLSRQIVAARAAEVDRVRAVERNKRPYHFLGTEVLREAGVGSQNPNGKLIEFKKPLSVPNKDAELGVKSVELQIKATVHNNGIDGPGYHLAKSNGVRLELVINGQGVESFHPLAFAMETDGGPEQVMGFVSVGNAGAVLPEEDQKWIAGILEEAFETKF